MLLLPMLLLSMLLLPMLLLLLLLLLLLASSESLQLLSGSNHWKRAWATIQLKHVMLLDL